MSHMSSTDSVKCEDLCYFLRWQFVIIQMNSHNIFTSLKIIKRFALVEHQEKGRPNSESLNRAASNTKKIRLNFEKEKGLWGGIIVSKRILSKNTFINKLSLARFFSGKTSKSILLSLSSSLELWLQKCSNNPYKATNRTKGDGILVSILYQIIYNLEGRAWYIYP